MSIFLGPTDACTCPSPLCRAHPFDSKRSLLESMFKSGPYAPTTRCRHYTLGRKDFPCPAPGCPLGLGHESFQEAVLSSSPGASYTVSDGMPLPPGLTTRRWVRRQLELPGDAEPIWAWRED